MKKAKIYVYEYSYKKEYLFEKLNNRKGLYHNYCAGEYLIIIKNECEFWLGVERAGHSGGYWYIAKIEEKNNKTIISGKIVYNPDEEGKERTKTFGDLVWFIIFSPLIFILNFIDIIAILGALAWLPQIIAWIYNWLKKPKLSIYHDGEAEIGYIKNGNAFNLRFSFLARDKHALIDDMELVLTDKDGAHHKLKWIWYSETFYELQGPAGNSIMAKQEKNEQE